MYDRGHFYSDLKGQTYFAHRGQSSPPQGVKQQRLFHCAELRKRDVAYFWFPMSEQNADMGLHSIFGALRVLQPYIERREPVIIHCFGGNNRSKLVYDSLFYLNFKAWPDGNDAVARNCDAKHLPSIDEYVKFIEDIRDGKSLDDCLRP